MTPGERILAMKPGEGAEGAPDISPALLASIKAAEGCRLRAYEDTLGVWTIGYGHAHVEPGTIWTQAECEAALIADIEEAQRQLDAHLPWWRSLDPVRRDAITELCFNMGVGTLQTFSNTLAALKAKNWRAAADGLLRSRWALQVKGRATRIAQMIASGER